MTNYSDCIKHLFSLEGRYYFPKSLKIFREISDKIGSPHKDYPSIHIAGTNWKGSVAFKLSKILQNNGYRVGLLTSPHITDFRERIQVNSKLISENQFLELYRKTIPLFEKPHFFQIATLIAFQYFSKMEVDIAVVEVGLGGRLDATNIINPILSVITTIGYDHTDVLGDSLEKIAFEKSGIIKKHSPVVVSKSACFSIIKKKATLLFVTKDSSVDIVKKCLDLIPFDTFSRNGLFQLPPCRYEKMGDIILDVAHNVDALSNLYSRICKEYMSKKKYFIIGSTGKRDISAFLKQIEKNNDRYKLISVSRDNQNSLENQRVILNAFEEARAINAIIIGTGSFFIMRDFLTLLKFQKPQM